MEIVVDDLPENFSSVSSVFDKYCNIFGVHIFATPNTPNDKVLYAANIMAEYLDNDGDGEVDNPLVINNMLNISIDVGYQFQSAIYMSLDENDSENMRNSLDNLSSNGDSLYFQQIESVIFGGGQDLFADETGNDLPNNGFDASLEETIHLISQNGYATAYPDIFGEQRFSTIANLMDEARGGYFEEVPTSYPPGAWYTYNDTTCSYECMITEYFYWGLLTKLNADWKNRTNTDLVNEWKINIGDTLMTLQERDPSLYNLLNNDIYHLPKILPSGDYNVRTNWYTNSSIESLYSEAYLKIYGNATLDVITNQQGRNILLDLYDNVYKDFQGNIIITYDNDAVKYRAGYTTTSVPTNTYTPTTYTPPPTVSPTPISNDTTETFIFDKSDIYTDIAYSYRMENPETYNNEIVHFYEKALLINPDNWRTLQYYGVYLAQKNDIDKANFYLEKLKTISEDNNIISYLENEINNIIIRANTHSHGDGHGHSHGRKHSNKKVLGPSWTRNEMEPPLGKKNMGGWIAAVYTKEQQIRLNIDETGNKLSITETIKNTAKQIYKEIINNIRNNEDMEKISNDINILKEITRNIDVDINMDETHKYTQIINKTSFTTLVNTSTETMNELNIEFDFTVVGGGPSGIMCAYKLSTLNPEKRILLLEKNESTYNDYKNSNYNDLNNWLIAGGDIRYGQAYNSTSLEEHDVVEIRLGKGLGGGTLHFGLQYIDQLDVLEKSSYEFTMTEFRNILNDVNEICNTQSYDIESNDYPSVLKNLFDKLTQHTGDDYIVKNNKIYSRDLQTRFSLAELLEERNNITVWHGKNVKNLVFNTVELVSEGSVSVNKIVFFESDDETSNIDIDTQVILCAGAINTPCILQRSLIGPTNLSVYTSNGLTPILPLPVGETLYDHTGYTVQYFHRDHIPGVSTRSKIVLDQNFLNQINMFFPNIYIASGNNIPDADKNKIWDFNNWYPNHPGGQQAISKWSENDYELVFPHDYARWWTYKPFFIEIGELDSIIDFDELPDYLKNDENVINLFENGTFTLSESGNSNNIADISSHMLGHIQTRDVNDNWQTYYSLIPDYSMPNNLLSLLVLTHATAGKINNNGSVYIDDLNDTVPRVNYNYSYEKNIQDIINALVKNNEVISSNTGGEYILSDISLSQLIIDNSMNGMIEHITPQISSIYHYHGTCGINNVVNYGQKVINVDNLSIGDLSILTSPIAGSTSVAAMVCGYRCAECLSQDKEGIITNESLSRSVNIDNIDSDIDVSYTEEGTNIILNINTNVDMGIYSNDPDINIINNTISIDTNTFDDELIIYIWEKMPQTRNIVENKCGKLKKLKLENVFRSFAGVRYISTAEHSSYPTLIRSVLGRSVWNSTDLKYILTSGYGNWTENEKLLIEASMREYSNISKLTFTETTSWSLADIEWKRMNVNEWDNTVVGAAYSPSFYGSLIEIYAGAYQSNTYGSTYPKGGNIGSWDYATFIHELGHALGLMHPHDNAEGSIMMPYITFNSMGDYIANNRANAFPFTIMTYNDIGSSFTPDYTYEYGYSNSLGIIDVAAIQQIYGINESYNMDDTIYNLIEANRPKNDTDSGTGWNNIWDTGGIDTLSAETSNMNSTIDLRPSSSIDQTGDSLYISQIDDIFGGLTISENVDIENAIGGNFDDDIYENNLDNEIDGKDGIDTVYFINSNVNYLVIKQPDEDVIEVINIDNNNEKNTLRNIEFIAFQNEIITTKDIMGDYILPETKKGFKITITKK